MALKDVAAGAISATVVWLGAQALWPAQTTSVPPSIQVQAKSDSSEQLDAFDHRITALEAEMTKARSSEAVSDSADNASAPTANPPMAEAVAKPSEAERWASFRATRSAATERAMRDQSALEEALVTETRDDDWAVQQELELQRVFAEVDGLAATETRCAATFCEIVLSLEETVAPDAVAGLMATAMPFMGEQLGYVTAEPPHRAVVYVARARSVALPIAATSLD